MTPGARIAAAIEILDAVQAGASAEQSLTNWGRRSRFAGSKDRAAVRDHVFGALRCRRSYAALGGGDGGRALMIGALRAAAQDPADLFHGQGHAPAPLSAEEQAAGRAPAPGAEALDCPDWLWPRLQQDLGDQLEAALGHMQRIAPIGIRVNLAQISRADLGTRLGAQGIAAQADPRSPSALVLEGRPRGLSNLPEWREGLFDLQDAGSQAVADGVPLAPGETLLDYCAGGGGKSLAVAARVPGLFVAHDAVPRRMRDLPVRAERAGVAITCLDDDSSLPMADTVLIDVPCSGSGTWRRGPEAKWALSPERLEGLLDSQAQILRRSAELVRPGGHLVYATCSLLTCENSAQIDGFLSEFSAFARVREQRLMIDSASDGYFFSVLQRRPI